MKLGIYIARVVNFEEDRLLTRFKNDFHYLLILIFITDTDHEVKWNILVD